MNALDLYTTSFLTAVVVITAGIVFLLETVVRRASTAGRFWAASFLTGILVSVCYIAWTQDRDLWIAVAAGNAAFVTQMGLMWLGCRVCNRPIGWGPRLLVLAGAVGAFAAAGVEHAVGDWAGAVAMFVGIALFALAGCVETRRGTLRGIFAAWGLTFVLGAAAAFYLARIVVFLSQGPESRLFTEWFGTRATSLVTISLTIVAVVSTSVLRATSLSPKVEADAIPAATGLLPPAVFLPMMSDVLARCARTGAPVALIAIRIDDVDEIGAAFGQDAAIRIESTWRDAVHRNAPLGAGVGAIDDATVGVILSAPTAGDAESAANALRQCLLDVLIAGDDAVLPAIGVAFALTSEHGYSASALVAAARGSAEVSADTTTRPVVQAPRRGSRLRPQ